jgi:hypothetical protein
MTMIVCTMNVAAPLLISDLLITGSVKPDKFSIPVINDDVLQYLTTPSNLHPIRLDQKVYILKSNVCIAFAGKVYYFRRFLEDISIFCKANDSINSEVIKAYLEEYKHDESWEHFSFLILVVEKEDNYFNVGRFIHGEWLQANSSLFGEVFATGSGAMDFLKQTVEQAKILSQFQPEDVSYTLQMNIILICKLFLQERLSLQTIRQHWVQDLKWFILITTNLINWITSVI